MVICFAAWISSFREGLIFCVNGLSVSTNSCALRTVILNLTETSDAVGTVSHILSLPVIGSGSLDISITAINRACIDKLLSQSVGTLGRWPVLHTRQMKVEVGDMLPIKPHLHEAVV